MIRVMTRSGLAAVMCIYLLITIFTCKRIQGRKGFTVTFTWQFLLYKSPGSNLHFLLGRMPFHSSGSWYYSLPLKKKNSTCLLLYTCWICDFYIFIQEYQEKYHRNCLGINRIKFID